MHDEIPTIDEAREVATKINEYMLHWDERSQRDLAHAKRMTYPTPMQGAKVQDLHYVYAEPTQQTGDLWLVAFDKDIARMLFQIWDDGSVHFANQHSFWQEDLEEK